jgi:hypothetical protein
VSCACVDDGRHPKNVHLNMKIDRDIWIHREIMTKVTYSNRKREGDRSNADDEQMRRRLSRDSNDVSSQ